jgi:hypothetical protein
MENLIVVAVLVAIGVIAYLRKSDKKSGSKGSKDNGTDEKLR